MTAADSASPFRVALVGPRETPFAGDPDIEHRETMLRSYAEICGSIATFGSDYTLSREFLGIEYLAATLRRDGCAVRLICASNEGLDDDALLAELLAFAPHVVGISVLYDLQLANAIVLARRLRAARPGIAIVFGGPLATAIAEPLLTTFGCIDYVIAGEGEEALRRLVRALARGEGVGDVPALLRRGEGGILRHPRGAPLDLDALPHPSRDALAAIRARGLPVPSAYLTTSRGCKAFCTFCTVPNTVRGMTSGTYRMRDPVDVVDEMAALVRDHGVSRFYMADDNFLGYGEESNARMLAFADELVRRQLDIHFHAECRVDSLVPETLSRLRAAGFDQILFGLESGSPRTLKRWAKGQTVAQNEAAIALARRLRIEMMPSLILLDWESDLTEIEETVGFIERNRLAGGAQPLWLVNKLKVHCGTAASRRYDKVHGRPPLPAVGNDDDGIRRWCAAATYQGIAIDNPYVASFWRALNGAANRWSVLLDEVLPPFLKHLRGAARHGDKAAQLDMVRRLALFRRAIGPALTELMRVLVDQANALERARERQPEQRDFALGFVERCERRFFADGLDAALRDHDRRRAVPSSRAQGAAPRHDGRATGHAGCPAVSVIIPTRDKPERLALTLHALLRQRAGGGRGFEVVVVADGGDAATRAAVAAMRDHPLDLRLIETARIGQAAARNRGAACARGDVLLFVDDDILLSPGYVETCVALCDDRDDVVVRAPVYLLRYLAAFRDPERGLPYDGDAGALARSRLGDERISRAMIGDDWPSIARKCQHRNRFERLVSQALRSADPRLRWLGYSGSGVALRRELFLRNGGYDEAFGLRWGAESIELGYRLWQGGARFVEAETIYSAHMDHPRGASLDSFDASFALFFAKHRDPAIREVQALILGGDRRPTASAAG